MQVQKSLWTYIGCSSELLRISNYFFNRKGKIRHNFFRYSRAVMHRMENHHGGILPRYPGRFSTFSQGLPENRDTPVQTIQEPGRIMGFFLTLENAAEIWVSARPACFPVMHAGHGRAARSCRHLRGLPCRDPPGSAACRPCRITCNPTDRQYPGVPCHRYRQCAW